MIGCTGLHGTNNKQQFLTWLILFVPKSFYIHFYHCVIIWYCYSINTDTKRHITHILQRLKRFLFLPFLNTDFKIISLSLTLSKENQSVLRLMKTFSFYYQIPCKGHVTLLLSLSVTGLKLIFSNSLLPSLLGL